MASYEIAYSRSPSSLKYNGVEMDQYDTRADAITAGRGWADEVASDGRLFLILDGGDTPWNGTVLAFNQFVFSFDPKIMSDQYYEGRVQSLPNLSMRVERKFSGVSQIGGGSLTLNNTDGFFNGLAGMNWDAGETVIKMGCDSKYVTMDYADYETVGSFFNGQHSIDETTFSLSLNEKKTSLRKKIPASYFSREDYSGIRVQDIGRPIPLAYGVIYSAKPICTDVAGKAFKIAGHAVYSIDAARYKNSAGGWTDFTTLTPNTADGTLVIPAWNGTDEVAVDFRGRKNSDGSLMDNASDIVADILAQIGETNINTASFAAARAALKGGTDRFGRDVTLRAPFFYIDKATEAINILSEINGAVASYLYADAAGQFHYKVFEILPEADLIQYTNSDIKSFSLEVDAEEIYSKAVVSYGDRDAEGWNLIHNETNTAIQYAHDEGAASPLVVSVPLGTQEDAQHFAQRALINEGESQYLYRIEVPWKGQLATPSTQIHLVYEDNSNTVNAVLEVLEQRRNLAAGTVSLLLGDLHGFKTSGFWVADASVFPDELGGGSTAAWDANWTTAQKTWAKQNVGYWTDDNGFADPADPESFLISRWT